MVGHRPANPSRTAVIRVRKVEYMERLANKIREMAIRIKEDERKRKGFAEFLRELTPKIKLFFSVQPHALNELKIVGIDGGLVKKSFHGFDCILVRAVGVCFEYRNGKVKSVKYYPSRFPPVIPDIIDALNDLDYAYYSSILRLSSEIETALKSLDVFSPQIILLDGSIAPHYSDRPSKSSNIYPLYQELVKKYHLLYKKCMKNGVILGGIVEDSRGMRFCEIIRKEILSRIEHEAREEAERLLQKTRDTNLLFWVLKKGERTVSFPYTDKPEEHPVLREFEEKIRKKIYSFYIKTAKFDRPIRVDFLNWNKEIDMFLSSVILSISGYHSGYGIPVPLIEADSVAKLSEMEMERFYSQIIKFTGNLPSIMKLRREERPF